MFRLLYAFICYNKHNILHCSKGKKNRCHITHQLSHNSHLTRPLSLSQRWPLWRGSTVVQCNQYKVMWLSITVYISFKCATYLICNCRLHYFPVIFLTIFTDFFVLNLSLRFSHFGSTCPGGVLPYIRYIGMCRPKGYGF